MWWLLLFFALFVGSWIFWNYHYSVVYWLKRSRVFKPPTYGVAALHIAMAVCAALTAYPLLLMIPVVISLWVHRRPRNWYPFHTGMVAGGVAAAVLWLAVQTTSYSNIISDAVNAYPQAGSAVAGLVVGSLATIYADRNGNLMRRLLQPLGMSFPVYKKGREAGYPYKEFGAEQKTANVNQIGRPWTDIDEDDHRPWYKIKEEYDLRTDTTAEADADSDGDAAPPTPKPTERDDLDVEQLEPSGGAHPFKGDSNSDSGPDSRDGTPPARRRREQESGDNTKTKDPSEYIHPVDEDTEKSGSSQSSGSQETEQETETRSIGNPTDDNEQEANSMQQAPQPDGEEYIEAPGVRVPKSELEFPWEEPPEMRFEDIGGYSDVKEDLISNVVKPVKSDDGSFERFGVEPSDGLLFHGPPGTGKTLFARALANALDRPFVELSQADLAHHHINRSPKLIKRLFEEAQALKGVVFIDEAEQLLGDRTDTRGHAEDSKVTNAFLAALTQEEQEFIVMLTTNNRENMDDAILRPGRVDSEFEIGLPDAAARKEIFKLKLVDIPHRITEEKAEQLARQTKGWTGADINELVNRARRIAANQGADHLTWRMVLKAYRDVEKDKKQTT